MLKPKALTRVLSSANTGGVNATLLLNNDGVLLAYSGYGESNVTVTAAIAANIWTLYEKHGHDTFHGDRMQTVLIECQTAQIAITRTANLLLCMSAESTVSLGMLKMKIEALSSYLSEPLSQIAS